MIWRQHIFALVATLSVGCLLAGCGQQQPPDPVALRQHLDSDQPPEGQVDANGPSADDSAGDGAGDRAYEADRRRMIDVDLRGRDITDPRLLEAMRRVPRHKFVPQSLRGSAYSDRPLPIGSNQTISQPYIVALMTQLARPHADGRALDIGTGSGYQAAVLAELVDRVYSIEIVPSLAAEARQRLAKLGYDNITLRCGDGYRGWAEQAPFDVIIVAAAPDHIPQPLVDQLAPGGRLVIPVGEYFQKLMLVEKQQDGSIQRTDVAPVAFVPMTGEAAGGP